MQTSQNLDSMLVPGLISGSRVDNVAVCASIVNLLALLGRKILYDSQLIAKQEQLFSQQLWSISGGLLQLQTRGASPGYKVSASSEISFLSFDFYRVDSTSQRGSNFWIFSSAAARAELGANFSISKNVVSDTTLLDVIVAVQEFAWKTSDPNYVLSGGSGSVSASKKFNIVGAVYGLKIVDVNKRNVVLESLTSCMNLSVTFDSLKVRQWVPQQRFAKVSIASYNASSMMYSDDNCKTIAVGPDHVQSCCKTASQFAVKLTPDATICSDGFADIADGESCDDGNLIDGDGCDKKCAIEQFYKCEQLIPNVCTIVPTNVSANCIPPRTCNGHGFYKGGSACVCEPAYFRSDCSLKLAPILSPSLLQNGASIMLAPGLNLTVTSANIANPVTIAAFNDSDVAERAPLGEISGSFETLRSTQMQFEFNPSIELKFATISLKLDVSGFIRWVGSPMLVNSNYSLYCRKPGACLWTQMRSKITSQGVMQVTISSSDIPVLQRCAIFEYFPVPPIPGPVDNTSLLVAYIGSGVAVLAIIAFFVRRKYKQVQTAKEMAKADSLANSDREVQAKVAPPTASLSPFASADAQDRQQIQSSPRELGEVDLMGVDFDLLDDSVLASLGIEGLSSTRLPISPIPSTRSMSISPSSGVKDSLRPISPPAIPRTPDGRRRPKVKGGLTPQSQRQSLDPSSATQSTLQESLRAAKSLSPKERLTSKLFAQSLSPMARKESPRRSGKSISATADLEPARASTGSRVKITGISPPPSVSASAAAATTASAVSRVQRTKVLHDADDDSSSPRGRPVLSDISPVTSPVRMAGAASSLAPASTIRGINFKATDIFQAADAVDIDKKSASRFDFFSIKASLILTFCSLSPDQQPQIAEQRAKRSLIAALPKPRGGAASVLPLRAASAPRRSSTPIQSHAGPPLGQIVRTLSPPPSAVVMPSVSRFMSGTAASKGKSKRKE